jgi:hypothetical protein
MVVHSISAKSMRYFDFTLLKGNLFVIFIIKFGDYNPINH